MKKENKSKPKYNMFQNSLFMIKVAWKERKKKVLVTLLLAALLSVVINLVGLYISPTILKMIENKDNIKSIIITILIFASILMIATALNAYISENTLFGRVQVRLAIINRLNEKAATTSYSNLDDEQFTNLLNKAFSTTYGNSEASEAIWTTLESILKNIIGFVTYMVVLIQINPIILIIMFATTLISYLVSKKLNQYEYKHREEIADLYTKLDYIDRTSKSSSFAKDINIFNLRPWIKEIQEKNFSLLYNYRKKANINYLIGKILDIVLTIFRNGFAYFYLINMVIKGNMTASMFVLYFSTIGGVTSWITGILSSFSTLHRQSIELCSVRECLDYKEKFNLDSGEKIAIDPNGKYEIKLENVSFSYPNSTIKTLDNINLTIHPYEKLAIVGLNGAGKSTLVKLICGLYEPTEGRILVNGTDVKKINRTNYYELFSPIFQDYLILPGSIALNVSQDIKNPSLERVNDCLEKVGLKEKIDSLEKGINTNLDREVFEDAVMLSGGQTQRLMLARALYKDAPIVVLDEPTAALDPIAEANLYQKYNEITLNKASLYISHRLASTRFCDRIILLDNNKIIEEGTHEELLKLNKKYAELYNIQSKYYKEEEEHEEK